MFPPLYLKGSLIYDFSLFNYQKQLCETFSMLENEIWDILKLCLSAIVTQIWLQNKLILIHFEVRAVFLQ